MTVFEKIIYLLQARMTTPASYGIFHIISFILAISLGIFLISKFRNASDKALHTILAICWSLMVISEIYKQFVFSLSSDGTNATWQYLWYAFPFQFCSTPLYALPFVIFMKEGKIRDCVMSFLATFSFFAGIAVMIYPNDVYMDMIGINVQTMLHHGMQLSLGMFLFAYNRRRFDLRFYLKGIPVFAAFSVTAMLLNEIAYFWVLPTFDPEATFNMFYVSPHFDCTLPILSIVYQHIPYPAFLALYILGFSLVAFIIYGLEIGVLKLTRLCRSYVKK